MQVFISHNKADTATAQEIALFLVTEGVNVWFDEWEISAGESIVGRVNEALETCTALVVLWSQNASRSQWVQRELNSAIARALETASPRVIPVRLDSTPLPALLRDLRYIRFSSGSEEDRRTVIRELLGRSPSDNLIRAVVKKYHELVRSPDRKETLGLRACPKCGSEHLVPDQDVEVDYDYDDGHVSASPTFIPAVRCLECDWSRREDDLEIA
jgi:hypothetical protein